MYSSATLKYIQFFDNPVGNFYAKALACIHMLMNASYCKLNLTTYI